MGGKVNWNAMNDIAEYLEVTDAELFIDALMVLQEHSQPEIEE